MIETIATVWITGTLLFWLFIVAVDDERRITATSRALFVLFWPIAMAIVSVLLIGIIVSDAIEDFSDLGEK